MVLQLNVNEKESGLPDRKGGRDCKREELSYTKLLRNSSYGTKSTASLSAFRRSFPRITRIGESI